MKQFCLPFLETQKFKQGLTSGKINPFKLNEMTSEKRVAFLEDYVGEHAKDVNLLFENKLLLKNKELGMINWAKNVSGIPIKNIKQIEKSITNRTQKMERLFSPKEEEVFLNDLVDQKLGLGVSLEEAEAIFELTKNAEDAKGGKLTKLQQMKDSIKNLENIPDASLNKEQKQALDSLKSKIKEAEDAKNKLTEERKAEADKIKEQNKKERDAIKAEERKQKEQIANDKKIQDSILREQKLNEKELEKQQKIADKKEQQELARLEKEIAYKEQELENRIRKEQETFERETARQEKKIYAEKLKLSTGESIKKIRKIFKKITNKNMKGIDVLSKDMQQQLDNILTLRDKAINGEEDRMVYGRARIALENYTNSLTENTILEQIKENPVGYVAGLTKSLRSTADMSALLRQGLKTLFINPKVWYKSTLKSFEYAYKTFGPKNVMDEIRADILSRPNYEKYRIAKLAVNTREEDFPAQFTEKIPVVGTVLKVAENAFSGFQLNNRVDLFDWYIKKAEENGIDTNNKKELESIGKLVNSITARGSLGKAEPMADILNVTFFSARKIKADFDTLTAHRTDGSMSDFAKKQALINLLKVASGLAMLFAMAKLFDEDSVEEDPRSADFGKIKYKNTRFDVTAGMSSLATLAARVGISLVNTVGKDVFGKDLELKSMKSSVTGMLTELNKEGFNAKDTGDVLLDFTENKLSPISAFLIHSFLTGKNHSGDPTTIGKEMIDLFTPLPIANVIETSKKTNRAPLAVAIAADFFGVGTNTYSDETRDAVQASFDKWSKGGTTAGQVKKELYTSLQKDGKTLTDAKKSDISHMFDIYKAFPKDIKTRNMALNLQNINSNNEKADLLKQYRKKMTKKEYTDFLKKGNSVSVTPKGRETTLFISDELYVQTINYE